MVGKKNGVYTQLKTKFPGLIAWHCLNHRLELSVSDAVKTCTETNHFTAFLDKLYCLYHQSPKNLRELDAAASEVGVCLRRIGRVLGVRWVASSFRTVKAIWMMYAALHSHLTAAGQDVNRTSSERSMYSGLAVKLSLDAFLRNLGLMMDALEELKDLSEALQARDIRLSQAVNLIKRQTDVFTAMSEDPENGPFYRKACEAVQQGSFNGIALHGDRGQEVINPTKFYEALCQSMKERMVRSEEESLFTKINILNPETWPSPLPVMYGESELRELCDQVKVGFTGVKQAYREYKNKQDTRQKALLTLRHAVNTISVSSAECERGFSEMNNVVTPLRSRLNLENVSALMFIKLVGPPLKSWKPTRFVRKWVATRRSADHLACRKRESNDVVSPYQTIWEVMN